MDPKEENKQAEDDSDEELDQIGDLDEGTAVRSTPPPGVAVKASGNVKANPAGNQPQFYKELFASGDYDPLPWSDFFESKEMILDEKVPFYLTGTGEGPIFLCIHGGGHSALSFAAMAKQIKDHGKGSVAAFDLRNHGDSQVGGSMAVDELLGDIVEVIKYVAARFAESSIVLVGHSLGGALAVKVMDQAKSKYEGEEWAHHLVGVVVIDVVEGTALKALPHMETFLLQRPQKFPSLQYAIYHAVSSGMLHNRLSARVSMPGQVMEKTDPIIKQKFYVWRIPLADTREHWVGWFKGMSKQFLDLKAPKMLLVATNETLDAELQKANFDQGKFKKEIVNDVGHSIQEDNPHRVAQLLQEFVQHFHIPAKHAEKMKVVSMSGKEVEIGQ